MMQMTPEEYEASIEKAGVVVGCLIKNGGTYLLVQEGQPDAYGLWNLPAGHVDKGEELQHAARREVKEETNLDVEIVRELCIIHEEAARSVKHIYLAEVTGGDLQPQDGEIMDVRWLTYDDVRLLNDERKLRKPWVWDVIQKDYAELVS